MVQEQRLILNCPTGKPSQGCIKKGLNKCVVSIPLHPLYSASTRAATVRPLKGQNAAVVSRRPLFPSIRCAIPGCLLLVVAEIRSANRSQ
jgi:hypothetical protein